MKCRIFEHFCIEYHVLRMLLLFLESHWINNKYLGRSTQNTIQTRPIYSQINLKRFTWKLQIPKFKPNSSNVLHFDGFQLFQLFDQIICQFNHFGETLMQAGSRSGSQYIVGYAFEIAMNLCDVEASSNFKLNVINSHQNLVKTIKFSFHHVRGETWTRLRRKKVRRFDGDKPKMEC